MQSVVAELVVQKDSAQLAVVIDVVEIFPGFLPLGLVNFRLVLLVYYFLQIQFRFQNREDYCQIYQILDYEPLLFVQMIVFC